ncbi:hypothetical protein [Bacillus subtilis]|uniref:hypothetical protein n=1 Tax=Bacillus subtilis TaxID=1423 RepID=UPI002DBF919D|nr:hypothetical protein [Bacillus subtilis]MEC2233903.1 hypothetical protein [Bacillus subtilis]
MNFFTKKKDSEAVSLGKYTVQVAKLTPAKWKQLFTTVDKIPGLVLQVLSAPKADFYSYLLSAVDIALDEVVAIVAMLSEVDSEYIHEEVSTDELIEYLALTIKKNRLDSQVKNVMSLLPKHEK